ncbi:MAG TPA: bifunctional UDP-N-acetylglucosamine diphosphorylase/glucosamine-1-phosphate N-acetyltransferase GlmU [Candidatus Bathyarchaeia archaeon]|nr:bifunctional UDP-N-acetylglucosamine diphosphorylase/glucosamine-1-phosphate N-acetyltransferase GlmU [Candidatus Bathyarchaeia archaeon]
MSRATREGGAAPSEPALAVVILAAGQGTRMKSQKAKVLHPLGGRPLIRHVLEAVRPLDAREQIVVVGFQARQVEQACAGFAARFVEQTEQRGTGHAVRCAQPALEAFTGDVLILYGDVPLLETETLRRLIRAHRERRSTLSLLTTTVAEPSGYGRIVRDQGGRLARIVEERDASPSERAIQEINPGIYCVESGFLFGALATLRADNAQGELYLTDIVAAAVREKRPVTTEPVEALEVTGINSRAELAALESALRERVVRRHMAAGVTFLDPASVYIDVEVTIGPDSVIGPLAQLRGATTIGSECRIDGNAFLEDATIGDRVHLKPMVVVAESRIDEDAVIGPFAQIRPGTHLHRGVHIGNFVEVKKAVIGEGTKANHLAYLGDATIGRDTNIGAGTITCNYDGFAKHATRIGDRVQVGSDSQLVAPVTIGDDAYVATGTTVRHDVGPGALAFNPKPDQRREGWVEGFRKRKQGERKPGKS